MKKKNSNITGAVLLAKQSGKTSFSSLWDIKHSLNTDKVGHTGTLDSFADGLLVVLTGHLTHLVTHITGFSKVYKAVVCFGKETDTLDPTGKIIKKGKTVSREELQNILSSFTGALLQKPPAYSAIHVDGKRASDMVRSGEEVQIEPRQIFVYRNELIDFKTEEQSCDGYCYALLEIECSKGTYIRSIARDLAEALGTCGHLIALRRTSVGPFKLEDAAGYETLEEFTIENALKNQSKFAEVNTTAESEQKDKSKKQKPELTPEQLQEQKNRFESIRNKFTLMTKDFAALCGFPVLVLKKEYEKNYLNGRPLQFKMFTVEEHEIYKVNNNKHEYAVFYEDNSFAGIISRDEKRYYYEFAVHPEQNDSELVLYTWEDIVNGKFNAEWLKKGTALTIGSFDGMHKGHQKLLDSVLEKKNLVPGIITFTSSIKGSSGELSTLHQKMEICTIKEIKFAVAIDFSSDFAKIDGKDFILNLVSLCGMKYLAEGKDFSCGYQGAYKPADIAVLSKEAAFDFAVLEDEVTDSKRISSSLIRDAVKKADFIAAEKMLGRPYSFDLSSLMWKRADGKQKGFTGEEIWITAQNNSQQVIPPAGNYNVNVQLCDEKSNDVNSYSFYKTICSVENESISILLPDSIKFSRIKAVMF